MKDFGGLEVELASADRKVVRRVRTAYDGFFEIRNLPLGIYTLMVTPEEVKRLHLMKPAKRSFTLDSTHTVQDGQDLVVEIQEAGEEAPQPPTKVDESSGPRPAPDVRPVPDTQPGHPGSTPAHSPAGGFP
jgi:hypothetical protein